MPPEPPPTPVVVVTGAGGMGKAAVRRIGSGCAVVLADAAAGALSDAEAELGRDGYDIHPVRTDVAAPDDVAALARAAADLGALRTVVHTAGVSPVQASAQQIVDVDFIGTALMLDAFEPLVSPGTVAVCLASSAASFATLSAEAEHRLATTPTADLRSLPVLDPGTLDPGTAYVVAKRAVQLRVEAAALTWARRGGRVVSISPGIIATPQGAEELAGAHGEGMRAMIAMSALGRLGTADEIAATAAFLASTDASLITGTDVLVDGGIVAAAHQQPPAP